VLRHKRSKVVKNPSKNHLLNKDTLVPHHTNEIETEGIIVHSVPLREDGVLVSVFTPHHGLVKLTRNVGRKYSPLPLTLIECVYRQTHRELCACIEWRVLNHYVALRDDLQKIRGACDMLRAIRDSQWIGKPAPHLYFLLLDYLHNIVMGGQPDNLSLSFRLKLLLHEGLLHFPLICSVCGEKEVTHVCKGQGRCLSHAIPGSFLLTQEASTLLERMALSRSYKELNSLVGVEEMRSQVEELFTCRMRQ